MSQTWPEVSDIILPDVGDQPAEGQERHLRIAASDLKSLRFRLRFLRSLSIELEAIRLRFCRLLCDFTVILNRCDCDFTNGHLSARRSCLQITAAATGNIKKREDRLESALVGGVAVYWHRVNGVGRAAGQAVFNQILTGFHGTR